MLAFVLALVFAFPLLRFRWRKEIREWACACVGLSEVDPAEEKEIDVEGGGTG